MTTRISLPRVSLPRVSPPRITLPRRLAAAAVALGLLLTGCTQGGQVKDPTPLPGATFSSLRIGISFDQPGLGTATESGESDGVTTGTDAKGFDVDTATYIAKALGVSADKITWVKADPVDRETLLAEGKVDLVLSTYTINDERAAKVDFAGPYFLAHQDLLIRRNDEELTGPERLEGRTLCAAANTTSAQNVLARYQGNIALVQPNTFSECVQQLMDGNVDAVTTDDVILAGFAAEPKYKGVLKVVGKGFSDELYGVGLPKGSTDLVQKVNESLTQYIADGSWKASLENNVGPSGYKIPDPPTPGSEAHISGDELTRARAMAALAASPPFDALSSDLVETLAGVARIESYDAGETMLDAFERPPAEVLVVLAGTVQLWLDAERPHDPTAPEVLFGPGDVLGLAATLTGKAIGPLAIASGRVRALHLPAEAVDRALDGAEVTLWRRPRHRAERAPATGLLAADLVVTRPLTVSGSVSVAEVAVALAGRRGVAAVEIPGTTLAVLTDRSLRERVLAAGLPPSTPAQVAAVADLPWVAADASAAEALILLLDTGADLVLVRGTGGELLGTIDAGDFIGSSVTDGLALHERFMRADSIDQLQHLTRGLPQVLTHLLECGLSSARVLSLYSALVDAIVRRMLMLVFARHPEVSLDAFTWLSLGSNGRRESTLSSDVDCAVMFHDDLPQAEIDRYRNTLWEVVQHLADAGLIGDGHGATAAHRLFARSRTSWEAGARAWLHDPTADNAAMMTSLLLDARPLCGEHGDTVPGVAEMFGELRRHTGTMRLLLEESLAKRAKVSRLRRRFGGSAISFDLKRHALLPMVNLARWAALIVGSSALPTTERLRAASGTSVLPHRQAEILIEVFEVLQAIRLRHQLAQVAAGRPPSDLLDLDAVSPIDQSIITRAVREIAAVQTRMANLARYENPEDWGRPDPGAAG